MSENPLVGSFRIHIYNGDQFIATTDARDDVKAGFGDTQNVCQEFDQGFVRLVV